MFFCPKCKQFIRNVVFGVACGCTVLTGHAAEPPQGKFSFQQYVPRMVANVSSTAFVSIAPLGTTDWGNTKGSG